MAGRKCDIGEATVVAKLPRAVRLADCSHDDNCDLVVVEKDDQSKPSEPFRQSVWTSTAVSGEPVLGKQNFEAQYNSVDVKVVRIVCDSEDRRVVN